MLLVHHGVQADSGACVSPAALSNEFSQALRLNYSPAVPYCIKLLFQATVDALADLEHAPPAVRLFAQYCTECREDDDNDHPGNAPSSATTSESTDPFTPIPTAATTTVREKVGDPKEWIGRSKVFVHCNNLAELRLPKFLHAYNAKPALIRESGSLVRYTS